MKLSLLQKKILAVVIGSIIAAYGITMAINAGFGGATLAVLWQGVAQKIHTGLGMASFIVALGMIAFTWFYDRKQIYFGTILYQLIYSVCVGVFSHIQERTQNTFVNVVIMLLGIVIFAVGTGIYASADWGRGSYEAVTFALADKNNWQVKYVRIALDISVVIMGIILGGKFGICTVCTVFLSGPVIQKTKQVMEKYF